MTQQTTSLQVYTSKVEVAIKRGFLPALQDDQKQRAIALVQMGFDPVLHLALYQERIIVTKPGHHFWLRSHMPGARITSRPVIDPLERDGYGLAEDELGVVASIYVPGVAESVATGFGKASRRPYTYRAPRKGASDQEYEEARQHPDRRRNPIDAEHPYDMAEKRAECQAIDKVVPLGIAMDVDDYSPAPTAAGVVIDTSSRDVTDKEAPSPPKREEQQPAPAAPPRRTGVAVEEPPTDAASTEDLMAKAAGIRTLGDLYNFAMIMWGKERYPDRLTILNRLGKRMNEITDADAPDLARRLVEITTGRLV